MENVYNILFLFASIGIFMLAVKITSDNMEKLANSKLRTMLNKVTGNCFLGVGIGTAVTAVIQSSAATTVMVIGLVNANVMNLLQATYVIMGANIGTTITAQIAALQGFGITEFFMIFTFIGVLVTMIAKTDKWKTIGSVVMGLGMIFVGLYCMSSSMEFLRETPFFEQIITELTNPFLLLLVGALFTALIQSSSAVTGILVAMATQNVLIGTGNNEVLFIILGSNIGTCITAILATIGSSSNGKRAAMVHLMFNILGALIFTVFLICYPAFSRDVLQAMFPGYPATQIAMFHTFFNVVTTLLLLPFAKFMVNAATKLIPAKPPVSPYKLKFIDERILSMPTIAVPMLIKEISRMARKVEIAFDMSVEDFIAGSNVNNEKIEDVQKEADFLNKKITEYLIKLSSYDLSETDELVISSIYHVIIDVERIGDLACNITRYTKTAIEEGLTFSSAVTDELRYMSVLIKQQFEDTIKAFELRDKTLIPKIDRQEDIIDAMRKQYVQSHIERLNRGECQARSASLYVNLINNMERVADHLNFIAQSIEKG